MEVLNNQYGKALETESESEHENMEEEILEENKTLK
jgi:hypothetical protein